MSKQIKCVLYVCYFYYYLVLGKDKMILILSQDWWVQNLDEDSNSNKQHWTENNTLCCCSIVGCRNMVQEYLRWAVLQDRCHEYYYNLATIKDVFD